MLTRARPLRALVGPPLLRTALATRQHSSAATASAPKPDPPTNAHHPVVGHPPPAGSAASMPSAREAGIRMREVLRNVAQPVVVAVTKTTCKDGESAYHGATLTSFASLTLEPHPLVAFSLRLPSRMADFLRGPHVTPSPLMDNLCHPSPSSSAVSPTQPSIPRAPKLLTVSLLAPPNAAVADALAKPRVDQKPIFETAGTWDKSVDPPALAAAVGYLRCEVVHSVPLRDVCDLCAVCGPEGSEVGKLEGESGSELFICRVVDARGEEGRGSLVHYQREYKNVGGEEGGGRGRM